MISESYRTSSIKKRTRRSRKELDAILEASKMVIDEEGAITLRHLFYRIVSLGLIDKTESDYRKLSGLSLIHISEPTRPY